MRFILFFIMILSGCSSTTPEQVKRLDPSWPDPIRDNSSKWSIIEYNNTVYVGMPLESFNDEFMVYMGDISRYNNDTKDMLCYYRSSLNEPKCRDN